MLLLFPRSTRLPRLVRIKQRVPAKQITNVRQAVLTSIERLKVNKMGLRGLTVGITVGSRGIHAVQEILRSVSDIVKENGGSPVLIPSMGTHGEGIAAGRLKMLASLGIKHEAVGAPILDSEQEVELGEITGGIPVYCNAAATRVDRLVIVNRIKTHTDFTGEVESGICKMMAIGLGGLQGGIAVHAYAVSKGLEEIIINVASFMLQRLPVAFAVGILENWKGKTLKIEAMLPEQILEKEKKLLVDAKRTMIKLPFKSLDVLVLGEIGKNISGSGMDTKVVGRVMVKGQKEPKLPKIDRIVVLGLTPESNGNAAGIGLADITTSRVFKAINMRSTAHNSINSCCPEQGRLPCVVANDYEAIKSGLFTLGAVDAEQARLVYIQNTLQLEVIAVSETLLNEVSLNKKLEVIGSPEELHFDTDGNLLNFREGLS